jgi:two-component system chemotaxis response regulator CheY
MARFHFPSRPRVLVVDDSVVVRKVLSVTLRQLAEFLYAEIEEAGNGILALRKLQTDEPYDLVLSDVRMPGMDGLAFVREVRTTLGKKDLPIIIISTLGTPEDVERGIAAGATGYVCKPIAPHHIMTELVEILDLHRR